jgi:tripartite-type tricarboxylate transporter receptor subunit TctC
MTFLSNCRPTFEVFSNCLWLACLVFGSVANAQTPTWPQRPIRIITPSGVGVAGDIALRKIAMELSKTLGQTVVVENRPGAAGRIAVSEVAHALPDGYTFVAGDTASMVLLPAMGAKLSYDPQKDFIPVVRWGASYSFIAVSNDSSLLKLDDLKKLGRPVTVGVTGLGSFQHTLCLSIGQTLGFECKPVPYSQGNAAAILDVAKGNIDMAFSFLSESKGLIEAGKIRFLGTTAPKRNPTLPDLPSVSEYSSLSVNVPGWIGLFAPVGTPEHIVDRLRLETNKVIAGDLYKTWLSSFGTQTEVMDGPEFIRFLAEQRLFFKKIVDTYGLKSE